MKECDFLREAFLTDYMDGQLKASEKEHLKRHLQECALCRTFVEEVKRDVVGPFRELPKQEPPLELWQAIKQEIENENQGAGGWDLWREKLKGWMVFPRLIPVAATLMVMVLVGGAAVHRVQIAQAQDKEQGEYLIALLGQTGGTQGVDSTDASGPIERYFL
ncbi:MAG: zf-HC2 domain-containing protein [Candidatus Omnitrophica bacterium]|nr:zf-HC2 domain-containing protein [Candidatus Omnitrophota bacterium]